MAPGGGCATLRDCSFAQACVEGVCAPPYAFFGYDTSQHPTWVMLANVLYHVAFCLVLTLLLVRVTISIVREKRQTGRFDLDIPSNSCRACLAVNCILYYFYTIFFFVMPITPTTRGQDWIFVAAVVTGVCGELVATMAVGVIGLSFLSVGVRTGLTSPWGYRCTQYMFAAMSVALFAGTLATFLSRLFVVGLAINCCYFMLAFGLHVHAGLKMTSWLWTSLEHRLKPEAQQQEPSLALQYYHNLRWCVRRITAAGLVGLAGKLVNIAAPALTLHITIITSSFQRTATSFILLEFTEMMRAKVGLGGQQSAKLNIANPATVAPEAMADYIENPTAHQPRPWFGVLGRMSTIAERSEKASMSMSMASGFRRGFASARSSVNPSMWRMGVAVIEEDERGSTSSGHRLSKASGASSVGHENEDGVIVHRSHHPRLSISSHYPGHPQPPVSHHDPAPLTTMEANLALVSGARSEERRNSRNSPLLDEEEGAPWKHEGHGDAVDGGRRGSGTGTGTVHEEPSTEGIDRANSPFTNLGTLLDGIVPQDNTVDFV